MGRTTILEENHVLKIVHPGKHIEIYTKPIQAFEVLRNYPKFCITRPDVFKFPWIVVRPDSLLALGKMFYLVPKRTLYRLLKANTPPDRSLLPLSPSSSSLPISMSFFSPLIKNNAGMTPKHRTQVPSGEDDCWENTNKRKVSRSSVESEYEAPANGAAELLWISKGNTSLHIELPQLRGVAGNMRRMRYSPSHVTSVDRVSCEKNGRGDKQKTTSLRSCMRKPGSAPRLANPRVRLSIPGEDIVERVTKQRTIVESLSRLATSLVVDTCR